MLSLKAAQRHAQVWKGRDEFGPKCPWLRLTAQNFDENLAQSIKGRVNYLERSASALKLGWNREAEIADVSSRSYPSRVTESSLGFGT